MTGLLTGLRSGSTGERGHPLFNLLSSRLAEISYTLYLFHFPLLCLLFFSMRWGQQQPGVRSFGMFTLVLCLVLLVTYVLWYVFERNTEYVRGIVGRTLTRQRVEGLK